jgi:perosamine synthetase
MQNSIDGAERLNTMLSIPSDSTLFEAAETALNNGIGEVIVVDASGTCIGRVTLDAIRAAVLSGDYLRALDVRKHVIPLAEDVAKRRLSPSLDATGKLIDTEINHMAGYVPVAEPLLSSREFRYVMDAFLSTWISSTGDYLRRFERDFAARHECAHGVAVSNGTVSLHLAMVVLGIGAGDEVIVPDLTFAASINTIMQTGATPVIVDVDPETWCISPEILEAAITPRTRAVMPVHVFGRPAPMTEIVDVARRHRIYIIEDCAEAHGATYDGKPVGSFSDIASFSFFGNKIVTSGEGGMCLTQSPLVAERLRILRDHGMRPERRYWHEEPGFNYRMTNLQAAVGCGQIERLNELLKVRNDLQVAYSEALAGIPGVTMPPEMGERFGPVAWFACALVPKDRRADLIKACNSRGIDLRPFFNGLSMMPAYRRFARPCPVSTTLSLSGVNLPTSHRVDDRVVHTLANVFRQVLA